MDRAVSGHANAATTFITYIQYLAPMKSNQRSTQRLAGTLLEPCWETPVSGNLSMAQALPEPTKPSESTTRHDTDLSACGCWKAP